MKRIIIFIIFLIFKSSTLFSQNIVVNGSIRSEGNLKVLEGASIVIKSENTILGYTFSDQFGHYNLNIEFSEAKEVTLEVNSLGFKKYFEILMIDKKSKRIEKDIVIKQKIENLSTVVIKSGEKLKRNRDTIAYKISAFKDGTEKNVEDMLKNLPGIDVSDDGNIRALGQPIKKILIEGEDLADANYKIISKNLDVSVLESIEIITNYQENPVLKQFLNSEELVLNLKLKDDKKSILFGKAEIGAGVKDRFVSDLNLGVINPVFKFLNLGFANNIGRVAGSQYDIFQYKLGSFNDFDKSFVPKLKPLVSINGSAINLNERNYIENKSFSNSLLVNKKLSKKSKIRNTLYVYKDSFKKEYESKYTYLIEPVPIEFLEKNSFHNQNFSFGNDLEITFTPSANQYFVFKNTLAYNKLNDFNALLFNNKKIEQELKGNKGSFDAQLQYTKKINNGAMIVDAYGGVIDSEQTFAIQPNLFAEENQESGILSQYQNKISFLGAETSLVFKEGKTSYSYTFGLNYTNEIINANTLDLQGTTEIDSLSGNNNAKNLQPHLQMKIEQPLVKNLFLSINAEGKYSFYEKNQLSKLFFLPNVDLGLKLRKTKTGTYRLGYKYVSKLSNLLNYLDNFLVKNYRNIYIGAKEPKAQESYRYYFGHSYSNIDKRIFLSTSASYSYYKNNFGYKSSVDVNSNISKTIYTKGQESLFLNTDFTTYIDNIDMSLKLGYNFQYMRNPSFINNSEVKITNNRSSFFLTGTSYFKGLLNFKFALNYAINSGRNSGVKIINKSFDVKWDAIFTFSKQVIAKLESRNYFVSSKLYATNQVEIEFTPRNKNWSLGLRAQNVFNNKSYTFNNISDYVQSEIVYKAIPRYAYLYGRLRF